VSGLDPKVTSEMYDLIYDLNRKDKITVIMISHDIMSAVKYATHILHIGDSLFFGTKDEYMWSNLYKDFADSKEAKYD
jgi:zinc transport system ATP-binding protein